MISIIQILKLAVEKQASDVHLTADSPPLLRVNGEIIKVNVPPLKSAQVKELCYSVISNEQKVIFENKKNLDFSFFIKGLTRFRGALMLQKASVAGVFRVLSNSIPLISDLGLPSSVSEIVNYPHGLVLVTGPTGSGKTTTLAACIDTINRKSRKHILTIEDPIEIMYEHRKSVVNQREVGLDCKSFADGLKGAMRADPDICLVGEIRDEETAESAINLAETGHLVFSTLHTNTAAKTIDRLVGLFGEGKRDLIRDQLSTVLQAIVSQRLVSSLRGGRQVVSEVMFANSAIRNLIRENKIFQLYSVIQTSREKGMTTMNRSLADAVENGDISLASAFKVSSEKDELDKLLGKSRRKFA